LVKVLASKSFHRAKFVLSQALFFGKVRFLKSAPRFLVKFSVSSSQAFLSGLLFLAKLLVRKVIFSASGLASLALAFLHFHSFSFSKVRLVKNCRACKIKSVKAWLWYKAASLAKPAPAQQSVHPTLGSLPRFQAFFYALSFFWLDGFAVPAPAQVTQTVRR
jgi:hypothetical protein